MAGNVNGTTSGPPVQNKAFNPSTFQTIQHYNMAALDIDGPADAFAALQDENGKPDGPARRRA